MSQFIVRSPGERFKLLVEQERELVRSLGMSALGGRYSARSYRNAALERQQMNIRLGEVRAEIRQFERAR